MVCFHNCCLYLTDLGKCSLHYVWYKIANMPVGWSLESPITMPPAPKPFWLEGPWVWLTVNTLKAKTKQKR